MSSEEEEGKETIDEYNRGPMRGDRPRTMVGQNVNPCGYGERESYLVKAEILNFVGNLDIEAVLDWLYKVNKFFDIMEVSKEEQVKVVAYNYIKEWDLGGNVSKITEEHKTSVFLSAQAWIDFYELILKDDLCSISSRIGDVGRICLISVVVLSINSCYWSDQFCCRLNIRSTHEDDLWSIGSWIGDVGRMYSYLNYQHCMRKTQQLLVLILATCTATGADQQALADWAVLFDRLADCAVLFYHHNEVACLMLGTMSPKLYQQFEHNSPLEMVTELQKMYGKPPGVKLQELVNMFHSCKQ
nr:transposon Ty3-I Gag-Pol polyprotein [Tanacetum cinerariifolium]